MKVKAARDFPVELSGHIDPLLYRRLEELYKYVYALQDASRATEVRTQQISKQAAQLLGVLREPLVGDETPDPSLSTAATVPGTVTDLTATGGSNVTVVVTGSGPGNGNKNIQVTISDNPTFVTVNVTGHYSVSGTQVVGPRGAAVADATSPDATDLPTAITLVNEIKAQFNTWLSRARAHGLIAP